MLEVGSSEYNDLQHEFWQEVIKGAITLFSAIFALFILSEVIQNELLM